MSVQSASANAHATAVLAVLNTRLAAMATPRTAHLWGSAPTTGRGYVLVDVSRMFGGVERVGGLGSTMWRVAVRAVGSANDVGVLLDLCTQVLEEKSLTVGGLTTGAIRFEVETSVDQDDGDQALYSGLRSFTYSA